MGEPPLNGAAAPVALPLDEVGAIRGGVSTILLYYTTALLYYCTTVLLLLLLMLFILLLYYCTIINAIHTARVSARLRDRGD